MFDLLVSCKTCDKQYIGNNTSYFRSRWNNHKIDVGKIENFYKFYFYKVIAKAFLKTYMLDWLIKHRLLIPLSVNFTEWGHLELCILMILILKMIISICFRFLYTFVIVFGSPSARVLFSKTLPLNFFSFVYLPPYV